MLNKLGRDKLKKITFCIIFDHFGRLKKVDGSVFFWSKFDDFYLQ
jgi:hypothetical protein